MATKQASLFDVDEDYIHIELRSSSNFFSHSIGSPSPPQNREFELQKEKKSTTSPVNDLFYKGKLLPLHHPPRLQLAPKLLHNTNATFDRVRSQSTLENSSFPFTNNTDLKLPSTNATTLLDSRNISPSQSRRASSYEANRAEYLFEWFNQRHGFVVDVPKKSWSQKLKETKQFWLSQKLKASRDYLKSLFSKSGCSNKSCAGAKNKVGAIIKSKCKDSLIKNVNDARTTKNPFEISYDNKHRKSCVVMENINRNMFEDGFKNHSRRSFSGVFQRHCSSKTSSLSTSSSGSSSKSSSFSYSSAGYHDLQLFKSNISANAEQASSIEAAIAHCNQSQKKQCISNKTPDDDQICSELASKTAVCGNQEKTALGMAEPKSE